MSSTNHTPNLGLSQWVLSDPFRMDDFNQDNAKIDAAVDGLEKRKSEFVKLKEITTTVGGVSQIDVDVSDIDFGAWQYLMVDVKPLTDCFLRLNGSAGGSFTGFGGLDTSGYNGLARCMVDARMILIPGRDADRYVVVTSVGPSGFYVGIDGYNHYNMLKSLNFVTANSGSTFRAGFKLTLWGVK